MAQTITGEKRLLTVGLNVNLGLTPRQYEALQELAAVDERTIDTEVSTILHRSLDAEMDLKFGDSKIAMRTRATIRQ